MDWNLDWVGGFNGMEWMEWNERESDGLGRDMVGWDGIV